MAKYTIVIDTDANPDAEAAVQKVTEDYNVSIEIPPDSERPPETSTPLSPQEYLQRVLDIAVVSYTQNYLMDRSKVVAVKFEKADDATRVTIEQALAAIPAGSFSPMSVNKTKNRNTK